MLNFECTDVFHENFKSTEKILINAGGTSSSKTYSICQLLLLKACSEPNSVITITGESIPNLKKGAYRDTENIVFNTKGLNEYIDSWNKSDRIIYFKNGSLIEFVSNLDEQSAKNGKRDYLFVNEANGIAYSIFFQLAIRTRKQIYIDYNPSAPFWTHDKLIGTSAESNDLSASVKLIISDHRHNNFLTDEDHYKIENIKDKELWRVYARGLTGNLEGIIFSDWKEIPDDQFPDCDFWGGLDFGYTNDPTAGVKVAKVGNNIFIHTEHDPDMVTQLRSLGLYCLPANKGKGSINAGISKLKEYNVYYTASSKNLAEERKRYMWIKDKITGKPTNSPIDSYNHLIDSCRYAVYTHFYYS